MPKLRRSSSDGRACFAAIFSELGSCGLLRAARARRLAPGGRTGSRQGRVDEAQALQSPHGDHANRTDFDPGDDKGEREAKVAQAPWASQLLHCSPPGQSSTKPCDPEKHTAAEAIQAHCECEEVEAARGRLLRRLEESTQELQRVEVETRRSFLDLENARAELRSTNAELGNTRDEVAALKLECQRSAKEADRLRDRLHGTRESSKRLKETLKEAILEVADNTATFERTVEQRHALLQQQQSLAMGPRMHGHQEEEAPAEYPRLGPLEPMWPPVDGNATAATSLARDLHFRQGSCPRSGASSPLMPGFQPRFELSFSNPRMDPQLTSAGPSTLGTPGRRTPSRLDSLTALRGPTSIAPSRIAQARSALGVMQTQHGRESREALEAASTLAILLEEQDASSPEAGVLLRRALAGFEVLLGPAHLDTLGAANNLAVFLDNAGETEETGELYRRASAGRRQQLGLAHPYTLDSLYNFASFLWQADQAEEAEQIFHEVRESCLQVFGPQHHGTLDCTERLAEVLRFSGEYEEAQALCRELLDLREKVHGPHHEDVLRTLVMLASTLAASGRVDEATEAHHSAVKRHTEALGLDDPATLELTYNLASFLENNGKVQEAEKILRDSLALCERAFGMASAVTLIYVDNLAILLESAGKPAEANSLFRRALQSRHRSLGWDHEDTLRSAANLAVLLDGEGQHDEALPLYRQVLTGRLKVLGEEHRKTLESRYALAAHLAEHGGVEEAVSLLTVVLRKLDNQVGLESDWALSCMHKLGEIHRDRGQLCEAEAIFRRIYESMKQRDVAQAASSAYNLAAVLVRQGRYAEGEPLFRAAAEGYSANCSPDTQQTLDAVFNLAACVSAQGRHQEAKDLYQQVAQGRTRILGPGHADTHRAETALVQCQAALIQEATRQQQQQQPQFLPLKPQHVAPRTQLAPQVWQQQQQLQQQQQQLLLPMPMPLLQVPQQRQQKPAAPWEAGQSSTALPASLAKTLQQAQQEATTQHVASPAPTATGVAPQQQVAALVPPLCPWGLLPQTVPATSNCLPGGTGNTMAAAPVTVDGLFAEREAQGGATGAVVLSESGVRPGLALPVPPLASGPDIGAIAQAHQRLQEQINHLQVALEDLKWREDNSETLSATPSSSGLLEPIRSVRQAPESAQALGAGSAVDNMQETAGAHPSTSSLQFFRVGYEKAKRQLEEPEKCRLDKAERYLQPSMASSRTSPTVGSPRREEACEEATPIRGRSRYCAAVAGFELPPHRGGDDRDLTRSSAWP